MHKHSHIRPPHRSLGFTMVEVLVALIIFAVGLLGVAGLQATGLRNTHQSYQRTVATAQAREMADRMRANMNGVRTGAYSSIPTGAVAQTCISTDCTSAELALHDEYEWNLENSNMLNGEGEVVCTDSNTTNTIPLDAGSVCLITVRWDSERTGVTGTECDPTDADNLACVRLSIIP